MGKIISIIAGLFLLAPCLGQTYESELIIAFNDLWEASKESQRKKATRKILSLNPSFEQVREFLASGKTYSNEVETGFVEWIYKFGGEDRFVLLHIPPQYDPQTVRL